MAARQIIPSENEDDWVTDGPQDDWVTDEPESVRPTVKAAVPEVEPVVTKSEPTLWERANTPLLDVNKIAKPVVDKIDEPSLDSSFPRLKGFGAGALQGATDLVTRMTSPLELGMALASSGASIARRGGLAGLSKGLEAANMALSGAEALHGASEVIRPDATLSERGSGLLEAGLGAVGAKHSLGSLKNVAEHVPTLALKNIPEEVTPEFVVKETPSVIKSEPIIQPQGSVNIDNTVDDMLTEALASRNNIPRTNKPKIKVRINPESNTLEPDMNDELTAKLFESSRTGKPVPENQRINPDTEIDILEAHAMADAHQREMLDARVPDDGIKAKSEAGDLTGLKQEGLPGNIREMAEPDVPGGKPEKPKPITKTQEWLGLPRAIQSAMDLSFPLRQGLGLIHTKGWWKAWPDMVKSFGSKETYDGVMESIANRPNFKGRTVRNADGSIKIGKNGQPVVEKSFAQKAGLAITDLKSNREEALGSALAEKIPGIGKLIGGSNRAYNAFANKLRADAFDDLIAKNPAAKNDMQLAKALADYVNNATGRGSLNFGGAANLEGAATTLNNLFFSPRLMASRMQMLNPKNYLFTRPEVRKEYLKSAAAIAGTWMTVAGLGKAAGAEISLDPESADFGKMKFGNTRIDPAGGFQQYLVLFSRLAKGGIDNVVGNKGRYQSSPFTTAGSDALNFLENKLAPNARLGMAPWTADKNRPFELGDQSLRAITPIILQDLSEIVQDDPSMAWVMGPNLVGMGSSTYGKGKKPSRLLPESIFPSESDLSFPLRR